MIGQTAAAKRYHRRRRVDAGHEQAPLGHVSCNRLSRAAAEVQNLCSCRQSVDKEVMPDFIVPGAVLTVAVPRRGVSLVVLYDAALGGGPAARGGGPPPIPH